MMTGTAVDKASLSDGSMRLTLFPILLIQQPLASLTGDGAECVVKCAVCIQNDILILLFQVLTVWLVYMCVFVVAVISLLTFLCLSDDSVVVVVVVFRCVYLVFVVNLLMQFIFVSVSSHVVQMKPSTCSSQVIFVTTEIVDNYVQWRMEGVD